MEPTRPARPRRRLAAALLASLALHLLIAWWFARGEVALPVVAPAPERPPIDVQIVQLPPERPELPPEPEPPPPPPPPPKHVELQPPPPPPPSEQRPPEPSPETAAAEPGTPGGGGEGGEGSSSAGGARAGSPTGVDLSPHLGPVGDGPSGTGRTITNHPMTAAEHGVAMAEEAARVKGRVEGWIKADIGTRRVQLGLVDPYFGKVRGALQSAVEKNAPDGMPGKNVAQQLVDAVLSGASSYGATGNPYGEDQVPNASPAEREFTGHAEEMARRFPGSSLGSLPSPSQSLGQQNMGRGPKMPEYTPQGLSTEQLQACAVQGKQLDDFLSGKFGAGLFATVKFRQAPDGKVLEAKMEVPSGMSAYDQYVMKIAPTALDKLPPPPDHGFGINSGKEITSYWRFEGRVKFKRPLKEWNAVTGALTTGVVSALYGLACPGLGPPVTFDPVTGELELIDLAHPKFTCQVKLVRVE